ncbi:hypothetical protein A2U01_0117135, partial [Trifolium medium]|nr:hypothetical protein [Trifolium medium]
MVSAWLAGGCCSGIWWLAGGGCSEERE